MSRHSRRGLFSWRKHRQEPFSESAGQFGRHARRLHFEPLEDRRLLSARSVLYLRVDYSDLPGGPISYTTGEPDTESLIRSVMADIDTFYRRTTYGAVSFPNDLLEVSDVLRMPRTSAFYQAEGSSFLTNDAVTVAETLGYATDDFDHIIVDTSSIFPRSRFLGIARDEDVLLNGFGNDFRVTAHELGHTLGSFHANYWDASGSDPVGEGRSVEYAGVFPIMINGNGSFSGGGTRDFFAATKARLGWLDSESQVFTVTASGVYRIYAFDGDGLEGNRRYAAKINDGDRNYWIEFRPHWSNGALGVTNGVVLTWDRVPGGVRGVHLIDTTPNSQPDDGDDILDSVLLIGSTFSDSASGVTIAPLQTGEDSQRWIDVQISITPQGKIRGRVFDDVDENGLQGPAEIGLTGITVYMDSNDNGEMDIGERTSSTDQLGNYEFNELPGGEYNVAVAGVDEAAVTVLLMGTTPYFDVDFDEQPLGTMEYDFTPDAWPASKPTRRYWYGGATLQVDASAGNLSFQPAFLQANIVGDAEESWAYFDQILPQPLRSGVTSVRWQSTVTALPPYGRDVASNVILEQQSGDNLHIEYLATGEFRVQLKYLHNAQSIQRGGNFVVGQANDFEVRIDADTGKITVTIDGVETFQLQADGKFALTMLEFKSNTRRQGAAATLAVDNIIIENSKQRRAGAQWVELEPNDIATDINFGIIPPRGDYNRDGTADAADYVVWRKMLDQAVPPYSGADGSGNGNVDPDDHDVWRGNFGNLSPAGLVGDFNRDDGVDAADYVVWRKMFDQPVPRYGSADGSGNGNVGPEDQNMWRANFGNLSTTGLAGDFSRDGAVDAADYVVWRKMLDQAVPPYDSADGSGNGNVGPEDHVVWSANFGMSPPEAGSGAAVVYVPTHEGAALETAAFVGGGELTVMLYDADHESTRALQLAYNISTVNSWRIASARQAVSRRIAIERKVATEQRHDLVLLAWQSHPMDFDKALHEAARGDSDDKSDARDSYFEWFERVGDERVSGRLAMGSGRRD